MAAKILVHRDSALDKLHEPRLAHFVIMFTIYMIVTGGNELHSQQTYPEVWLNTAILSWRQGSIEGHKRECSFLRLMIVLS